MMKEMLEKVCKSRILTSLEPIPTTLLNTRKKFSIFRGVDLRHFYHLIFSVEQKSRFILKNAQEFIELEQKLELHVGHIYRYKHIIVSAPVCSKALLLLQNSGWKVYK